MDGALHLERCGPAGGRALHNMSAPPAMRIAIWPLAAPVALEERVESRLPVPGYRCFARVDLEALLQETCGGARPGSKRRLAALVLLARGESPHAGASLARLARQAPETLEDELRELAVRLDPRALGLPVFAVARTASGPHGADGPAVGTAAALALLTRTAGQVFVAARSPRLAWLDDPVPVYRYFAPVSAPGEDSP